MDPYRIEAVGQTVDEQSGRTKHAHDVFENDQKVGSFFVETHDGKMTGFKLGGGLRAKHASVVMRHLSSTYGTLGGVKKSLEKAAPMTMPVVSMKPASTPMPKDVHAAQAPKAPEGSMDLSHDRRRIKLAVRSLLGRKETPSTPNGQVNNVRLAKAFVRNEILAKALLAAPRYQALTQDLQGLAMEVSGRSTQSVSPYKAKTPTGAGGSDVVVHPSYDKAAYMLAQAQANLSHARRHMLQKNPSVADRIRAAFGREPLHNKFLNNAELFLTAAKNGLIHGDTWMYANGFHAQPEKYANQQFVQIPFLGRQLIIGSMMRVNSNTAGMANNLRRTVNFLQNLPANRLPAPSGAQTTAQPAAQSVVQTGASQTPPQRQTQPQAPTQPLAQAQPQAQAGGRRRKRKRRNGGGQPPGVTP